MIPVSANPNPTRKRGTVLTEPGAVLSGGAAGGIPRSRFGL